MNGFHSLMRSSFILHFRSIAEAGSCQSVSVRSPSISNAKYAIKIETRPQVK